MRFVALLLFFAGIGGSQKPIYPDRWVYVWFGLQDDTEVDRIREIARTASEHGLNGMVLAANFDMIDRQGPAYLDRLAQVRAIAGQYSLEIVPSIFNAGYGGGVLTHNRNLAEGLSVKDALFVASGTEARLVPDPAAIVNGGFEQSSANRAAGYTFQDRPGEVSFIDTEVFHGGGASLRFENFGPSGNARVMQQVAVRPNRCYQVTAWVRTEKLQGTLQVQVLTTGDLRNLAPLDLLVPATTEWSKVTVGFNSGAQEKVGIYAGVWSGRGGRFWVDDLAIEEVGLVNVLRRPGTPLVVRSDEFDTVYEEGTDYAPVYDAGLNFRFDHDGPPLRLLASSRIRSGERLLVSWYHGQSLLSGQVAVCMSEPEVWEIWARQAEIVQRLLEPKRWLIDMNEIRMAGSCEACRRRGIGTAEILGGAIARQFGILRELNPKANVFCWSDMLDPNHNARDHYFLVEGDYSGSWQYVPPDLGIACWYYQKRRESLQHFSGLGFRTLAAAYYDEDTLDNPRGWLAALDETPGAGGIMYTTWHNKYDLLAAFGDLLSGRD